MKKACVLGESLLRMEENQLGLTRERELGWPIEVREALFTASTNRKPNVVKRKRPIQQISKVSKLPQISRIIFITNCRETTEEL